MYKLRGTMDKKQTAFLVVGLCFFTSVIYILSLQKTARKSSLTISNFDRLSHILALPNQKPNFVFILTDDQDSVLGSIYVMKSVQKYIIAKGISFQNSFVASPLCCPSRSSIFSGQYVHNHKAFNNSFTGGCSSKTWQTGPEKKSFVTYLKQAKYRTFFAGKYLNQYGKKEAGGLSHIPPGWDWWIGLKGNSRYYNYTLSVNGTKEYHGTDPSADYFTNVIRRRALQFLGELSPESVPFFMMLSTPSCHAPFTPEPKYDKNFTELKVPRTSNFNVANDETKHWLLRLGEQPLRQELVDALDEIFRQRLRTLLTVDDTVKDIFKTLKRKGLLNSTYVIFTSDNGFHLGQFSLPYDKREPYEFDVRVPLFIRGPGVLLGTSTFPVTNIDIAPTILDLAGIAIPRHFDGESFKPMLKSDSLFIKAASSKRGRTSVPGLSKKNAYNIFNSSVFRKTLLIEHSGEGIESNDKCEYLGSNVNVCDPKFDCKCADSKNNTYSCLRHLSQDENFVFCLWEDNEEFEEMYDLVRDFDQLSNIAYSLTPEKHKRVLATLNNLRKCRGHRCNKLSRFVF